jgi:hypothetical protein
MAEGFTSSQKDGVPRVFIAFKKTSPSARF